jgi:hypothetical protein
MTSAAEGGSLDIGNAPASGLSSSEPKVLLGVPLFGRDVPGAFYTSSMQLHKPAGTALYCASGRHVAQARNSIVEYALARDFTHVYMMDADMVYPQQALMEKLASDVPAVVGFSLSRQPTHVPLFAREGSRHKYQPVWPSSEDHAWYGKPELKLQRTKVLGGAGLLVKREVFEAIERPWFSFNETTIDDDTGENTEVGEDVYFTQKVVDAGFDIYCRTDIMVAHITEAHICPGVLWDDPEDDENDNGKWGMTHEGVGPYWAGVDREAESDE